MDFVISWSPLFGALGAVALAVLLVVGHPSPRRAALSLALVAVAFFVVDLIAVTVRSLQLGNTQLGAPFNGNLSLYTFVVAASGITGSIVNVLSIASWALLLYAAAQSGQRARLVAFTLVLLATLALQISITDTHVALLGGLFEWARHHTQWAELVTTVIKYLTAVAALVCAFLLPVTPATPEANAPAAKAN